MIGGAFSKFIQATRGYVPHERDSLAKDQFEIYQAGRASHSSRIPSGELGELLKEVERLRYRGKGYDVWQAVSEYEALCDKFEDLTKKLSQ